MNTDSCDAGLASDRVLLFSNNSESCSVALSTFNAVIAAAVWLRLLVTALQWIAWASRFCRGRRSGAASARPKPSRHHRAPIVPMLSSVSLSFFALLYALAEMDIANQDNGLTLFLLGCFYFPLVVESFMYQRRIISLGARMFPWFAKKHNFDDGSVKIVNLAKYDLPLRVQLSLVLISSVQFAVSLIICSLIVQDKAVVARIGFASFGQMFILAGLGIGYQLDRVTRVIAEHLHSTLQVEQASPRHESRDTVSAGGQQLHSNHQVSRSSGKKSPLSNALFLFRIQQAILFSAGFSEGLIWLLHATNVIPFSFWWLAVHSCYESLTVLPVVLPYVVSLARKWLAQGPPSSHKVSQRGDANADLTNGNATSSFPPNNESSAYGAPSGTMVAVAGVN